MPRQSQQNIGIARGSAGIGLMPCGSQSGQTSKIGVPRDEI